jgi:hypothetical protein
MRITRPDPLSSTEPHIVVLTTAATMCYIIYTLHQRCEHRQYSNTFACHIARGAESHETTEYTIDKARFLPDAENRPIHLQENASKAPTCRKRYPTRPVNSFCDACKRSQLKKEAFGEDFPVVASERRQFSQSSTQNTT